MQAVESQENSIPYQDHSNVLELHGVEFDPDSQQSSQL